MFYPAQARLRRELLALRTQLPLLDSMATFSEHSKVQRQILKLEKELEAQADRDHVAKGRVGRLLPHFVTFMMRFGYILPAYKLWGHLGQLVVMPEHLLSWKVLRTVLRSPSITDVLANLLLLPLSFALFVIECLNFAPLWESAAVRAALPFSVFHQSSRDAHSPLSVGVIGWVVILYVAAVYTHRAFS